MQKLLNEIKNVLVNFNDDRFNNIRVVDDKILFENEYVKFKIEVRNDECYFITECEGKITEFGGENIEEVEFEVGGWLCNMVANWEDICDYDDEDF